MTPLNNKPTHQEATVMASELKHCPFCSKTMMLRSALWPSEGDADAIIHADPTDCPMLGFSDGSADGSIIEKWNCSLSNEDDFPSDGSCVRCGSVPRNANGLCNTCLDEDAERLENTRPSPVAPVSPEPDGEPFQNRVKPWMLDCFGEEISNDKLERCDRFIEEALELVQAIGYSPDRARALVDYVFNREIGEPHQEVGGVMVTLAALCLASDLDMAKAGEDELARIWTKVEKIRAKQAAKPTGSALPVAVSPDATGKCGELVTVAWTNKAQLGFLKDDQWKVMPMAMWAKEYQAASDDDIGLCDRSQAEELLAAERAHKEIWKETAEKLERYNAALTARVEELETRLEFDPGGGDRIDALESALGFSKYRNEALEAKLAAAEKALEFYADASKWADGYFKSEDDGTVLRAYPSSVDKDQGDKARAALGGKPS